MTSDFPIYSESVISTKNRKGQTLLRFWQNQLSEEFRCLPIGTMLWRSDGKRNRYVSNLCNRSLEYKLCEEYARELSQKINATSLKNQIHRFSTFLTLKTYRHDILLRRISELLRLCVADDTRLSEQVSQHLFRCVSECNNSGGSGGVFQAAYLLTILTIYAAAGDAMDHPGLSVLQNDAYCMAHLWGEDQQKKPEHTNSDIFLSVHSGILQDNAVSSHRFFGREEELFDLREMVCSNRKCLISGIGGIGKTELIRQLLRLCTEERMVDKVVLIPYRSGIAESFLRAFPVYQNQDPEEAFISILCMLKRQAEAGCQLLLIIDNMDNYEEGNPALEELLGLPFTVLITSRRTALSGCEVYHIKKISAFAGTLIFRDNYGKVLSKEDRTALNALVQNSALCHPLTLRMIAKAAASNGWTVAQLAQQLSVDMSELSYVEDGKTIRLDQLYRQMYSRLMLSGRCREVAELFAILPRNSYSAAFLTKWFPAVMGSTPKEVLDMLTAGGWLDMDDTGFSMHPLIAQCLCRKNITEAYVDPMLVEIRRNLPENGIGDENVSYDAETVRVNEILIHISALLTGKISQDLLLDIMKSIPVQKWTHNAKEKYKAILNQLVKHCSQQDDLVEVRYLTVLGNWFFVEPEQVEQVYQKQKARLTVPKQQFLNLCLANAPTLAYEKPALAEQMLQEVFNGGALPQQIALAHYHMAALRYHEGDSEGAIRWSREGAEYASAHPECGDSFYQMNLSHLCMQYLRKGAMEEAQPVLEQLGKLINQDSLPIQRMKYADMRGMWALNSGKPEEALEFYSQNAKLIWEFRGEDVNYVCTRVGIGRALAALKRYDAALMHLCAARDYFKADGDAYYHIIVLLNIAKLYLEQKLPQRALTELEDVLDTSFKVPPQMQADVLCRQADAYQQMNDSVREKKLLNQVLAVYQENGLANMPQFREIQQRLAELEGPDHLKENSKTGEWEDGM